MTRLVNICRNPGIKGRSTCSGLNQCTHGCVFELTVLLEQLKAMNQSTITSNKHKHIIYLIIDSSLDFVNLLKSANH